MTDIKQQSSSNTNKIIVGDVKKSAHQQKKPNAFVVFFRKIFTKKIIILAAAFIIVFIMVIAGSLAFKWRQSDTANKNQEFADKVVAMASNGQYDQALNEISSDKRLKNSAEGAILTAIIKINNNDYAGALAVLKNLEDKHKLTAEAVGLMAVSYEGLGNKKMAIEYLQKQIDLIQKEPAYPMKDADIKNNQQQIEELKK